MKQLSKNSGAKKIFACLMMMALVLTTVNIPTASAKKTVAGKSIKLNKKKATLKVGKTLKLKATVKPKKATIIWKTSNKKVASVKDGKVTAKKAGKATITASIRTSAGKAKKASCIITVQKPDTGTGGGPDASAEPGTTSGPDASLAPGQTPAPGTEMTPLPAPAAQADNPAAAEATHNATALIYGGIGTNGSTQVFSGTQEITQAGEVTVTATVPDTVAAGTELTNFYVDTGIAVSSTVYKVSKVKLSVRDTEIGKVVDYDAGEVDTKEFDLALSEGFKGNWEVVFVNADAKPSSINILKGVSGRKVNANDVIKCTFTLTEQTPDETAASRAKALKRIPLRAGEGNNSIEAKVKVMNAPKDMMLGMSFGLKNASSSTGNFFLGLDTKTNKVFPKTDNTYSNSTAVLLQDITADGEYTFSAPGLPDATDFESLQFQSNVSNKDEKLIIQILSIKINGQELVIANAPRVTATTPTGYMADFDTNGTWAACGRNIYGGFTKDPSSPTSAPLAWDYIGTAVKADGGCVDNISRNYFA